MVHVGELGVAAGRAGGGVDLGVQRAHEPVFGRQRQAGRDVVQRQGGADDRLVGELPVRAVHHRTGVAAQAVGIGPDIASAKADIGLHRQAEVEVIQRVRHHTVGANRAAAARHAAEAGNAVHFVLAVVALDLGADAVAEAVTEADHAAPAEVELGIARARRGELAAEVDVAFHQPVDAGAGTHIETADRLGLRGDRQSQHRRGKKRPFEAHLGFSSESRTGHRCG